MKRVLVTGGGGFVGSSLVRALLKRDVDVVVAGRSRYSQLEEIGVTCVQGDISDRVFTDQICKGVDTVFHTAAKAGIWGKWQEYFATNVVGTKNIVDSCRSGNIDTLVYTSTPSVVFANRDIFNGDETLPYSNRFLCNYSKSKVIAENYVLDNNDENLSTCAIRPHLIWGPGDPHLVPRLIEKGRNRELKIVGSGQNRVDITYIENVVHAHVLAADNLEASGTAAGKAYFIGQEQPVNLWQWINELYADLDIPVIYKQIPLRTAYLAGAILEGIHHLLRKNNEPRMTRFLALQLGRSHYFSHERAREDLGYMPVVSLREGQQELLRWIRNR